MLYSCNLYNKKERERMGGGGREGGRERTRKEGRKEGREEGRKEGRKEWFASEHSEQRVFTNLQHDEDKIHSDSDIWIRSSSVSHIENKHPNEYALGAEGHEVKKLKCDKEGEVRDDQTTSSHISSVMTEEREEPASSKNKDKEKRMKRESVFNNRNDSRKKKFKRKNLMMP